MFLLEPSIFGWDLAILILLAFFLSGAIACFVWKKRHARKRYQRWFAVLLGFFGFFGFLVIAYGSFIEPQIIVTDHFFIDLPVRDHLKIVVVSDIHVGPYKKEAFVRRLVEQINRQLPDLVLLPGDFILTPTDELYNLEPLKDIHASVGVYAVLGNHDMGRYETIFNERIIRENRSDEISSYLTELGITMLRNNNEILQLGNGVLAVAGIDDLWATETGTLALDDALNGIPPATPTILLSHNPSIIDESRSHDAHLIVSGHTHGGQIRIPGYGPVSHLPTTLGQSYDQGLFPVDADTTLAITRGAGESSARARLFAWPEVMVLETK